MSERKWSHWIALALACWLPLKVSQVILNETVACRQLDLALITLTNAFDAKAFRISPPIYEAIYQFGIASTSLTIAVIAIIAIATGLIVASVREPHSKGAVLVAALLFCGVFAADLPAERISPHSCLSENLIMATAGNMPDDEFALSPIAGRENPYKEIGNTGSSLKDAFDIVYRVLLGGWLLAVVALGVLISRLRSSTPANEREALVAATNARLTLVIFAAGAAFAICMIAVKQYNNIGLSVLKAYLLPAEEGKTAEWAAAYEAYSRAVELHWGGVGSLIVGSVYLTALAFIWLRSAKWKISHGMVLKDAFGFVVKLLSIAAPFLTATLADL